VYLNPLVKKKYIKPQKGVVKFEINMAELTIVAQRRIRIMWVVA
jgi:hypothetical protein